MSTPAHPLALAIDHTQLNPSATQKDIERLCNEARTHGFYTVCVAPIWVALASELLADCDVKVCTVVGFPTGAHDIEDKIGEAYRAIRRGADEVDMVINLGALRSGRSNVVLSEIETIRGVCNEAGQIMGKAIVLKVIIEICALTDTQVREACRTAIVARADYVKTSSGFGKPRDERPVGATVERVQLMAEECDGTPVLVKASGGIRTRQDALAMLEAGASRLGCSASLAIIAA